MNTLKSKEESWSYIHHGSYDVLYIKNMINNLNEEWAKDTSRQDIHQTHRDTQCISIIKMPYEWIKGSPIKTYTNTDFLDVDAKQNVDYIINDLENKINGKMVRFEIINMDPFSRIRSHKDRSDIGYLARRIHIPIITNDRGIFNVDGLPMHMKVGEAYEINNIKWHSVFNKSEYDRVHIIADVFPYEFYVSEDTK